MCRGRGVIHQVQSGGGGRLTYAQMREVPPPGVSYDEPYGTGRGSSPHLPLEKSGDKTPVGDESRLDHESPDNKRNGSC